MENKIIYMHILNHICRLPKREIRRMISQYGSPQAVCEAGWNPNKRFFFEKWTVGEWEKEWEVIEKEGIQLISYLDERYPKKLLNTPNFPLLFYVKGELLAQDDLNLAIVGTRNATLYGKEKGEQMAEEVAAAGICVVSGLARGIDTAAHLGALKGKGRTIGVIGSGLSHIYPQENRSLAEKIAESGAVISEFPMETTPARWLFPQRNRIISGMSKGVFLVESPLKGGGMITMQMAEKQNKLLFTLPGRVDWPSFSGNHFLLKQKKALLVENGDDLLKHFKVSSNQKVKSNQLLHITDEERAFLELLPVEEISFEELVLLTQLPTMKLNVLLTRLILKKVIMEFPGKIYKRKIWERH